MFDCSEEFCQKTEELIILKRKKYDLSMDKMFYNKSISFELILIRGITHNAKVKMAIM